jgi:aminoglycoside phosphotransferase (APT) family kinase protein
MERLPGAPLYGDAVGTDERGLPRAGTAAILRRGAGMVFAMPRLLARVDLRIHAIDAGRVIAALEAAGLPWRELTPAGRLDWIAQRIEEHALDGLRPALAWLRERRPPFAGPSVVCHGDMQPLNLLMRGAELTGVVDWANTSIAPAELQVGWTRATYLTLILPLPRALRFAEGRIARALADGYTRAYARARRLDPVAVRYFEAFRCLLGLVALATDPRPRDAWNSPEAIRRVRDHFASLTGVAVS